MAKKVEPPKNVMDDPFVQEILAKIGSGGGGGSYLGLPGGIADVPQVDTKVQRHEVRPRYFEGAELMPVTDMDPVQRARLQDHLVAAGLLDTDYRRGVWDEPSIAAFKPVLALANRSGKEWPDALADYVNSLPMEIDPKTGKPRRRVPGAGRDRAPLVTRFTNPDDLAMTANEVAQRRLGRRFTGDEMNRFVQSYQAQERGMQSQAYAAGAGGGSYVEAPTAETAANLAAEKIDPVAAQARNVLPLIEGINELINGVGFQTTKPGE